MSTILEARPTDFATDAHWLPVPASVYRVSVDQYEAMIRFGVFANHDRLHLIDGILVAKMSKKPPHVIACEKSRNTLMRTVPAGWRVMVEAPVRIPDYSEPEPDIALARGTVEDYEERHPEPRDVPLIVEVAESSLQEDRDLTLVYGRGGVERYWIVNLVDYQVEVHWDPGPRGYRSSEIYTPGQTIPLVIQGTIVGHIAVDDLLPRRS